MEDAPRMFTHGGTQGIHRQFVEQHVILNLKRILFNGQQRFQSFASNAPLVEGHHRLTEPEEEPTYPVMGAAGRANADGAGLFVNGKISNQNTEDINAPPALFNEVAVFNGLHLTAPSGSGFAKPPLEGCGVPCHPLPF